MAGAGHNPPPPRGDYTAPPGPAAARRRSMRTHKGLDQAALVIQPMPGSRKSEKRRPHRGQPWPSRAETASGARRAATPPPKPNFAAHQTMTVNRSIIAALYIGWFLLPSATSGQETLSMLLVDSGRAAKAHRRHFLVTSTHHLTRASGNCNQGCRQGGMMGAGQFHPRISATFCSRRGLTLSHGRV